jgi:hypothetical protein
MGKVGVSAQLGIVLFTGHLFKDYGRSFAYISHLLLLIVGSFFLDFEE